MIFTKKPTFDFTKNQTPNLSLILQNKRELASASSPVVVLKSEICQNFDEIIGEIEKWVEILK